MRKNIVRSDCVFSNLVGFFSGEALISLEPNLIFNGQDYKILKAIFETNEIQIPLFKRFYMIHMMHSKKNPTITLI